MIKDDNLKKLLLSRKILSSDEVNAAVQKQRAEFEAGQTQRLLGDILVEEGLLSSDKLKELADNAPTLMLEERASQDLPEDVAKAAANPANDLGKYIKMGALGRGGMGVVVKSWDRNLRRYVALKFLETTSPEDLKRFQREAQLAASLRHPNIVQVHEMGSVRGRAYIAMDYVQGHSLEKYGGKIPPKKLFEIMSPICDALSTAHAREIIHRDVKPHNIMIDIPAAGQSQSKKLHPYIMDFGLAKVVNMDSSLSVSGVIMGTPHYMSPEQASGQINAVDPRSDLYSLGATMYWLLSGKAPLDGETPLQIVLRLQTDEPPPLRKIKPDVPADVDTIIMKCLAKDKSQRYQTAEDLKLDLDLFLADQPIKARAPSLSYLLKHKFRKHKAWVVAGAAFALVLLIVTGFFVTRLQNLRASRNPTVDASKRERSFELFTQARAKVDKARTELSPDARAARRDRLNAAIKELDEAVKLNPNEAGFYFYRAEARYLLWLGRKSIPDYEKALALDPKLGDALYRKIMVNVLQFQDGYDITLTLTQGRPRFILSPFSKTFDAAAIRSDLDRLRALGEHKAKVHCVEGALLFYEGKYEEAGAAFEEASKLESFAEPIALRGYVGLVMENGPISASIVEELDRAITLDPNMPLYYVLRAVAYLTMSPDWRRERGKEAQP
ncbi:MAG TPA: protein kinase, partial [Planctomycetota bacterium]|nr:protein kinase [Planctomycetota bacterium]